MQDIGGWLISGVVALIGWGFRVEMKIREHDQAITRHENDLIAAISGVKADLTYIRSRIDRLMDEK